MHGAFAVLKTVMLCQVIHASGPRIKSGDTGKGVAFAATQPPQPH